LPGSTAYEADLIQNKGDRQALESAREAALACGTAKPDRQLLLAVARRVLSVADSDTQLELATLKSTVRRMAALPGPKTIVLVSSGFTVSLNLHQEQIDVIDRAIRSGVTISTLDARGLYTVVPGGSASSNAQVQVRNAQTRAQNQAADALAQQDVLAEIADGTGGTFFHNNNDLEEGFRRTSALPEFTYVLGFTPQELAFDGKFHPIKVTIAARELTVSARRGYYAPRHASNAVDAEKEVRAMLFSREEVTDIPVELETQLEKADKKSSKVTLIAHVDLKQLRFQKIDGTNRAVLRAFAVAFDRNAAPAASVQQEFTLTLSDERLAAAIARGAALNLNFNLRPGTYTVRVVLRDKDGNTTARNSAVEIP
jgi:hypothetical protein